MKNKKITVREIAMIGVMAALVFAASSITSISIPTPASDNTRLHLGNVMCLLSGLLLGPIPGGLAAGIGSMFFDLTNPLYIDSAPFTLVFKFLMAFICGKIAHSGNSSFRKNIIAATAGALVYVILYLSKSYLKDTYFLHLEQETVLLSLLQKAIVSTINAIIAVTVAIPLATAIKLGLRKANFSLIAKHQN